MKCFERARKTLPPLQIITGLQSLQLSLPASLLTGLATSILPILQLQAASFICGVPGKALQGVAGGEVTSANSRKNCANSCAMSGNGFTLQHTMAAKTHIKSWTSDILWPFMLFYGHFMPILWPRLMTRPHLACSRMTKCHTSGFSCAPTTTRLHQRPSCCDGAPSQLK